MNCELDLIGYDKTVVISKGYSEIVLDREETKALIEDLNYVINWWAENE